MRRAAWLALGLALAVLLAGCATGPKPGPWTVAATVTSEEARQALDLADAAAAVFGPGPLDYGGRIVLMPAVADLCFPNLPPGATWTVNGCVGDGGVYVRWPLPGCADLTCSALPHELAHVAAGYRTSEGQADAGALLIVQEYRRRALPRSRRARAGRQKEAARGVTLRLAPSRPVDADLTPRPTHGGIGGT